VYNIERHYSSILVSFGQYIILVVAIFFGLPMQFPGLFKND